MKKCSKCDQIKEDHDFIKDKRATTGLRCCCRKCSSKSNTEWNRKNKDKYNAYRRKYTRSNRGYILISSAKKRAKKKNIPFNLDQYKEEIQNRIDSGFCEISGIKFDLENGRTFASPSIDRIIPNKGYVYSNIRIVCDAMNLALGDWGEDKLYAVVTSWINKRNGAGSSTVDEYAKTVEKSNINPSIDNVQA